jgi:C-terminal processing protease CtpA/Prc
MRQLLFFLLLWVPVFCLSQPRYTEEQMNRIADAGKVYGYIRYFHPYLQYRKINWDSAFAASVEGIIQARNKAEYFAIMQQLLSSLNDNLTTVLSNSRQESTYQLKPTAYHIRDSILYIDMNDVTAASYRKVQEGLQNLSKVQAVQIDMRKPVNSSHNNTSAPGLIFDWSPNIFKGEVLMPSFRSVSYVGLPSQKFGTINTTYFKESKVYHLRGYAEKEVPLIFIVENADQIPSFAPALQQKGTAAIIHEAGQELVTGKTTSFYIQDSLIVKMRLSEGLNPDGSLQLIRSNETYLSADPFINSMIKSEKTIKNGFKYISLPAQAAPLAIDYASEFYYDKIYPDIGYRMLAAAKIFSTVDHFFPYKKMMDKNWEKCYRLGISKFLLARDSLDYLKAVAELYANINDGHGFISPSTEFFSLELNPIIQGRGSFIPPVITRLIENKVVVTGIYNDSICKMVGIRKGDIILSIDEKDPLELIEAARKYQPASNKDSQTFFICNFILFGKEGQIFRLKVRDSNSKIKEVLLPTLTKFNGNFASDGFVLKMYSRHERPTYKLLSRDIGYVDLTSPLQQADIDSMYRSFESAKAIIFDVRGYPHYNGDLYKRLAKNSNLISAKFVVLTPSLPNVRDVNGELVNIEETTTSYQDLSNFMHNSELPVFKGKIVMLMDESAQSWSEHTGLILKAVSNATFIGWPTAGANGGITEFNIPGHITLWFSGTSVSYPNGKPLQRAGLQPDIYVRPTIKGIQAGIDEVLERAVEALGSSAP